MTGEGLVIAWVLWQVGSKLVDAIDRLSDVLRGEEGEDDAHD